MFIHLLKADLTKQALAQDEINPVRATMKRYPPVTQQAMKSLIKTTLHVETR